MTGGSSFAGGKGRIYAFFMENHTDKEKVRFLKDEYGIGGRSHACPAQHTAAKITMGKDCTIKSRTARMFT